MTELPTLPGWRGGPFATQRGRYYDSLDPSRQDPPRIYLELWAGIFALPLLAMVDTAAPWCIFRPEITLFLKRSFEQVSGPVALSTRLGTFSGNLYRGPLSFTVLEGERFETEATIFASPDWTGPNVLGYEGLLQRIRFAVDPEANLFYFGRI